MTEKLTITGSADLIATIPHLLGNRPKESFVVLTARGNTLGATLRMDAPAESAPLDYAQMMTTYAANDEKATGSFVIVYTDETGGDGQFPYAEHIEALSIELSMARMPVRQVLLVTSAYWGIYGTAEKNPLDAIKDSQANATLTYFGSATDIDVYNPALLGRWAPPVEAPEGTDEDLEMACGTWEAVLDTDGVPDTEAARALAAAFQHRHLRDYLFRDTITTHNGSFGDVLTGKFTGRPDWARVDRAEAIAFELMKVVPAGQRAPMLTLMGWLQWLKGHGSQADRYLKLAAEDVSDFRLAVLLRELINRGHVADVARNENMSYNRRLI
ncbi:DUF4192 family protein [Arthrobacter sp. Soil761]|uniref:DUF4192 family protein n=1 Tax=Arthrobacter sp. Soil761 TaxID=1736400 RepID=UPI0006FBA396|nr:DUF4192 family protein [Arthrobacter sp. Soil761]KRE64409.1 hypothetical protein ASG79_15550 [Arthrobacter sp. Soil761]